MPASVQDEEYIEGELERLCSASIASSDLSHDQVREYIYVHEFQLALDLLAHIQLKSKVPPSPETRTLFDALAEKMGMTDGDMWRGVARLRQV
jgi:hypothetical protein